MNNKKLNYIILVFKKEIPTYYDKTVILKPEIYFYFSLCIVLCVCVNYIKNYQGMRFKFVIIICIFYFKWRMVNDK